MHTCFEERSTSVKMVVRKTHDHILIVRANLERVRLLVPTIADGL